MCGADGDCEMCPRGTVSCKWSCSDLKSDRENCGACGHACARQQTCVDGGCACPSGTVECSPGICSDLQSDVQNCGACGHACDVSRQVCTNGACAASSCVGLHACDCGVEVILLAPATPDSVTIGPDGAVVYSLSNGHGATIYRSKDRTVTPIGEAFVIWETPSVSSTGMIAFSGTVAPSGFGSVFRYDGSSTREISTQDLVPVGPVAIDGNGNVAFRAGRFTNPEAPSRVYESDGMTLTPIEEPDGYRYLWMNDAGDLFFGAQDVLGIERFHSLIVRTSGQTRIVAAEGMDGVVSILRVTFNDVGSAAFVGGYEQDGVSGYGLFTGGAAPVVLRAVLDRPDDIVVRLDDAGAIALCSDSELALIAPNGARRTILQIGDRLFGSTVTWISLNAFRGQGQLVFTVRLDDGRQAIVRLCVISP